MPRRVNGAYRLLPEGNFVTVLKLARRRVDAASSGRRSPRASVFDQLARRCDVVSMGVGFHHPAKVRAVLCQYGQIAIHLVVHRIDQQCLKRRRIDQ